MLYYNSMKLKLIITLIDLLKMDPKQAINGFRVMTSNSSFNYNFNMIQRIDNSFDL